MADASDAIAMPTARRATAPSPDPHRAWARQAANLNVRINSPSSGAHRCRLGAERDALIDRIIDTPASSISGVLILARIVADHFEGDADTEPARASRTIMASLERLAEGEARCEVLLAEP